MKSKLYLLLAGLFLFIAQVNGQAPNFFNYQGVARDASGAVIPNQKLSLRFTIHQHAVYGTEVYSETQSDTTNQFGLFTAVIGSGTVITGSIANISWGTDSYYLQVEMDVTGGSAYIDFGAEQLLSVPYAFYAQSANTSNNKYVAGKGITINDSLISAAVTSQNVAGSGITINDSLISAQNTDPIWNANELEGSSVSLDPPSTGQVLQWDGFEWEPTTAGAGGWNLTGNAGTTYGSNFIGTTDDQGVAFEVNNQIAGRLEDGNYNNTLFNTGFGVGALQDVDDVYNYGASIQGYNVAVGYIALQNNYDGTHNTAVGGYALQVVTNGNYNTGIGGDVMWQVTGSGNTAAGFDCMEFAQSGSFNTASGYYALYNSTNTDGMASNVAIGSNSLYNNNVSQNVAVGDSALASNYSGTGNTAMGYQASDNNQYGSNNTSVGYQALSNDLGGTGNTALGFNANVANYLTNTTVIGSNAQGIQNNTVILGDTTAGIGVGIGTGTPTTDAGLAIRGLHIETKQGNTATTITNGTSAASASFAAANSAATGDDVGGGVTITTVSSSASSGVIATINFGTAYTSVPAVVITPTDATTASIMQTDMVYVTSTTTGFSINFGSAPATNTTFNFNYFVIEAQ